MNRRKLTNRSAQGLPLNIKSGSCKPSSRLSEMNIKRLFRKQRYYNG
jgi:hypothetical protein